MEGGRGAVTTVVQYVIRMRYLQANARAHCPKLAPDFPPTLAVSQVGILEELQSEVDCWMDGWMARASEGARKGLLLID